MANTKEYKIVINGLNESINAVESLNKQLDNLEKRMNAINATKVSTGGGSSRSGGGNNSALTQEQATQQEINKLKAEGLRLDAKIAASQDEIYKRVDATKQLYKETIADQKAIAAQERLTADAYSNTMAGMKAKLADIKAVINTTDLGDSDKIKKMTQEANELTNKLKEMEEAYGQFGRNVGNYASAAEGFNKLKIEVGATTREFNSAREASKTLKNELYALEIQGKSDTKEADNLRQALYKLQSAMDDATKSSRIMDNAMDFMQSFTAMASIGNGLQAFFGFDDTEITRSIQKLVALQGVLNGLENIRKQMETREGIGKILGKGFENIDKWTYGLRRMNVQLMGTGTSARIAAAGIKTLNYALKGLMSAGLLIALDLIVEGIQKLVGAIKDWAKGDADLIDASQILKADIDTQNKVLEKNLDLIKKANDGKLITDMQAKALYENEYARALAETNKILKEREGLIREQGIKGSGELNLMSAIGDKGVTTFGGFNKAIGNVNELIQRWDYLKKRVEEGKDIFDSFWLGLISSADDAKDEFNHLNKIFANDFINAMYRFADGTREGTKALVDYINKMDELTKGRYSQAIKMVKVDNEYLQAQLDEAWSKIETLRDKVFKSPIIVKMELDAKIESELDKLDPTRALQRTIDEWTQVLVFGVDDSGRKLTEAERKNIEKIIAEQKKNLAKQQKQRAEAEKNAAKKLKDEAERVEREINRLRIENMKEGLEKTIAQLQEERRERLQQARDTGIRVGELTLEINKLYDKKIADARKEHAKEVYQIEKDMMEQIQRLYDQTFRMTLESELTNIDTVAKEAEQYAARKLTPGYASYGGVRLDSRMSDELKRALAFDTEAKHQGGMDEGMIRMAREYLDLLNKIRLAKAEKIKGEDPDNEKYNKAIIALNEWLKANETTAQKMEELWAVEELRANGLTTNLSDIYKVRISEATSYYNELYDIEKDYLEKQKDYDLMLLDNERDAATREENNRYEEQMARLEEQKEKGLVIEEKYNEFSEQAAKQHEIALMFIQERHKVESEAMEQQYYDDMKKVVADGVRGMLNEYRDAYDSISRLQSRQPELASGALGELGIINLSATRKNYNEALDALKELSNSILEEKIELQKKLDNNEITFDDFQQAKRELDGLSQDVADTATEIDNQLKNAFSEFMGSIAKQVQMFGQSLNSLVQAFGDYVDQQYENEINQIEEQLDKIKELYDKQEEIVNEHKNKLNEIEDELANARGSRRQHLIDQLNAEMAAQRAAFAEQKRLEKEEKALTQKKDREEKKRKQDQKKMAMTQAVINGATAFMNALAQQPIWLGIAMAAMTAAMTAVQVATISSAKYATGGVIQGKAHSQGGVKVLGGQAEVEGGEFITNKYTTSQNTQLLSFINDKKRKLNIDDFIEFYSNDKTRKNISKMSPTRKFAEGGVIPSLRSDISVDDRLLAAFEAYAERPSVVSVVDINNRQSQVKNVQVLAGLTE